MFPLKRPNSVVTADSEQKVQKSKTNQGLLTTLE